MEMNKHVNSKWYTLCNINSQIEICLTLQGKGLYPARYAERDVSEAIAQSANKVFMLDPNHTHYLFVDKSQSERMYLSNSEFNALLFDSIKMPRADSSGQYILYILFLNLLLVNHF